MAISIHALREEGDFGVGREDAGCPDFYPRPPRGGRHVAEALFPEGLKISIHALREEGDPKKPGKVKIIDQISIHALREEGD